MKKFHTFESYTRTIDYDDYFLIMYDDNQDLFEVWGKFNPPDELEIKRSSRLPFRVFRPLSDKLWVTFFYNEVEVRNAILDSKTPYEMRGILASKKFGF